MARLVRHRQTKEPETDRPSLKPPRHASTLLKVISLQSECLTVSMAGIGRRLRVQYPGDNLPSDGPRQRPSERVVRDDADRDRFVEHLGRAAVRCSWKVFAFVIMSNHFHVVLRHPSPTLREECRASFPHTPTFGLGGIDSAGTFSRAVTGPNWWRMRPVFGRSRGTCISTLSARSTGRAARIVAMVQLPRVRQRSKPSGMGGVRRFAGLVVRGIRWLGLGACGCLPTVCYRRTVAAAGIAVVRGVPWLDPRQSKVCRSRQGNREGATATRSARESRRVEGLSISRVSEVVQHEYGIELSELGHRGSRHPARAAMAYLARRYTAATNGELTEVLGVSRAESVPNLTRRFDAWLSSDSRVRRRLKRLEDKLAAEAPFGINLKLVLKQALARIDFSSSGEKM